MEAKNKGGLGSRIMLICCYKNFFKLYMVLKVDFQSALNSMYFAFRIIFFIIYIYILKKGIIYAYYKISCTCVVTPPAGLWRVAAASKVVQSQHVSSAPWPVSPTVLNVSIILQRTIRFKISVSLAPSGL